MKNSILYCIALFIGVFVNAQIVNISTDMTTTLSQARANHYGINFQRAFNPSSAAIPSYKELVAGLNPSIVRYHAAEQIKDGNDKNWVNFTNQTWDTEKIAASLAERPAGAEVLMTITGWPGWFNDPDRPKKLDAAKIDEYALFCAELVNIVNIQLGYNVTYWEPFNEKDKEGGYDGAEDMAELATIYKACRDQMLLVDPTIKMVAASFREPFQTNIDNFLSNLSPTDIDIFSHHQYGGGATTNVNTIYNRADNFANGVDVVRTKLNDAGFTNTPIWLDEWNIYFTFNQDTSGFMTNEVGGVFDALAYKYLLERGVVDALFAWNAVDGIYGKIKSNYSGYNPGGHVVKLLREFGVGAVKTVSSSNTTAVEGLTIQDPSGKTLFVVINRSQAGAEVNFNAGGWEPDVQEVDRYRINSSGLTQDIVNWSDINTNRFNLGTNEVLLFVTRSGGSITNQFPIVSTSANQQITLPYDNTKIIGFASDADGIINNVQWTQLSGPTATLVAETSYELTVSDLQPDQEYLFQFEATDDKGGNARDFVIVYTYSYLPGYVINSTSLQNSFRGTERSNTAVRVFSDSNTSEVQNDSLTITLDKNKQFEKIFKLQFLEQTGLNLTENANVSFNLSSDVPLTLRVKLIDIAGSEVDTDTFLIDVPGNGTRQNYNLDFQPELSAINSYKVKELQLMQLDPENKSGQLVLDDLLIGNVDTSLQLPPVAESGAKRVITLPFRPFSISLPSLDPDGSIVNYQWEQISGPSANLANTTSEVLDILELAEGNHVFRLSVIDNDGLTSFGEIVIKALNNNGAAKSGISFLIDDFTGTLISDDLKTVKSNFSVSRSQNDQLQIDYTGMDKFEKPYILSFNDGFSIDLTANSQFRIDIASSIDLKLRIKLLDLNGRQIDKGSIDLTGDSVLRTYTRNFESDLSQINGIQVSTIEIMSLSNGPLDGRLIFDNLKLGRDSSEVPVVGVSIPESQAVLLPNETFQYSALITPENADDKSVQWLSSDTSVATIDATGLVTAVAPGTTSIQVSTNNGGFTDSVLVKVNPPAGSGITILNPIADSYIKGGSDKNKNFGTKETIQVKNGNGSTFDRKSLLKFNVSLTDTIASASLRLYGKNNNGNKVIPISVFGLADDSWIETEVTWQNALTDSKLTPELGIIDLDGSIGYREIDVTAYINAEITAADSSVSFLLENITKDSDIVIFQSKETTTGFLPELYLTAPEDNNAPKAGFYKLQNRENSKFMDANSDNKLYFKSDHIGDDRTWEVIPSDETGYYYLRNAAFNKFAYARSDNSPRLSSDNSSETRKWKFILNGKYYQIKNKVHEDYLGVTNRGYLGQNTNPSSKTDWAFIPTDLESNLPPTKKRITDIYPNPAKDLVTISCSTNSKKIFYIRAFDFTGRFLKKWKIKKDYGLNNFKFDVSGLPSGLLVIKVSDGKTIDRIKLIKE